MLLPLISTTLYLSINYILSRYKNTFNYLYQNNKTYKHCIKSFAIIHNLALCIFSFYTFYNLFLLLKTNNLLIDKSYGETIELNDNNSDKTDQILNICWLFTYSKIWEFFDTWILQLMGKETILLQKFHHFGAVWCWYYVCLTNSSTMIIATYYNSIVHTIMYFYYMMTILSSNLKFKIPSLIKPIITTLQLIQLNYGNYYVIRYYLCKHLITNITHPAIVSSTIFIIYVYVLVIMFLNFYYKNYIKLRPKINT